MIGLIALLVVLGIIAFVTKLYERLDRQKRRHENELMMKQWKKDDHHED